MCALWANINANIDEYSIDAYNIDEKGKTIVFCGKLPVHRIHSMYSQCYYDRRKFGDKTNGIAVGFDGTEAKNGVKIRIVPKFNDNMLGYMAVDSSGFDNPDLYSCLLIAGKYNGNGFYLRKDNYLEKLPMFAASRYITYNRAWTERARIMKSADGADKFYRDVENGTLSQFLLKCLLFTCLEMQNHMRTFTGSDGRFYRNELCLDGTNGQTIALRDLGGLNTTDQEQELLQQWETVLDYAKKSDGYNSALTYGVYQIFAELDTSHVDENTGNTVWDNIELHSAMATLKTILKAYYNTEIVPMLFKYEFLK
jgi:hypothetical protein